MRRWTRSSAANERPASTKPVIRAASAKLNAIKLCLARPVLVSLPLQRHQETLEAGARELGALPRTGAVVLPRSPGPCITFLSFSKTNSILLARAHPDLCTYHPPSESHRASKRLTFDGLPEKIQSEYHNGPVYSNGGNGTVTIAREDWDRLQAKLSSVEKSLNELKSTFANANGGSGGYPIQEHSPDESVSVSVVEHRPMLDPNTRHMSIEGVHTRNEITGEMVHIGGSSVPALVLALGRGNSETANVQDLLGKSILPIFGLDNESATYPFVDLWGLPHASMARVHELCRALPVDSECLSFFRHYKDTAHVVYPAIVDIDKFEQDLLLFLINRASLQPNTDGDNGVNEQSIHGQSLSWVGLLFAALASGVQCTVLPRKERELTSQVFVCCAFECLRFTNFLSSCNLEMIQTLLVLGNVLSNNMNAGVAWSLLGLTIRLAQTLGLHRACPVKTPMPIKLERSKVWWALVWQDSLLSVTFDRASSSTPLDHPSHYPPHSTGPQGNRSYEESMYRLCRVGLEIVRDRQMQQNSHEALLRITEHRNELQDIMFEAADYLRDSRRCRSIRDQLEHWALYLHISYITSELCRPAISPSTAQYDLSRTLRKTCIDSLANTVEAFLGLQNVTPFACRSWAAMHRSLSSALLLGILREPLRNERVRGLLDKIVNVLSDVTSSIDPAELSAPIARSITAIRKLLNASPKPKASPATNGSEGSPGTTDSYSFDESGFVDISPLLGIDLGDSPYAMMDSILWGGKKTP